MKKQAEMKSKAKKAIKAKVVKAKIAKKAVVKKIRREDIRSIWIDVEVHSKLKEQAKKENSTIRAIVENLFIADQDTKKEAKKAAKEAKKAAKIDKLKPEL